MKRPHSLGMRELELIRLYGGCTLRMTPEEFCRRWDVSREQLALICQCSLPTINRWFSGGQGRRDPEPIYERRLAEAHFLLKHYEKFPTGFRRYLRQICSPVEQREDRSP